MRTDSFSKEKHLPVRRFIADESKVATGLYGPRAIADDLDNLFNMFDPDSTFLNGSEKGGISEKNMQNGAVSFEKLGEDVRAKFQGIATEQQLSSLRTELIQKNNSKADKATTLSGYGITDTYTAKQMKDEFLSKEDFNREKGKLVDKDGLNSVIDGINHKLSQKTESVILYEDVVNSPEWSNQPTCVGTLDPAFTTSDFYYVTLNDASGNALPSGQFMLKDFYTDGATVFSTVFSLTNLNTGTDSLVENYPVEFISVGANIRMRDAGVWSAQYDLSNWKLNGNRGAIRMVCDGEFIQRMSGAYMLSAGKTSKNVSNYHSLDDNSFQSELTTDILPYASFYEVPSYKKNKFIDELVIERVSDTCFLSYHNVMLRCLNPATDKYKVMAKSVVGHGQILAEDTLLKCVRIQVAANANRGFIRNGSVIRVTEVK